MNEVKSRLILGIDPGSRHTGYGIVVAQGKKLSCLATGCIRVANHAVDRRLAEIFEAINEIIKKYQPHTVAIEEIFFHRNPNSALKLGQARGVAIAAAAVNRLAVAEYSARQIKQATVGFGGASKQQVQHMVRVLLNLKQTPVTDAADALAVAICHAHTSQNPVKLASSAPGRTRHRRRLFTEKSLHDRIN